MKNNGIGSRTKHVDIRMRFLNNMVENGKFEVDHCSGNFITPDVITENTPEAVRKVRADTMYNEDILPPDYNRSNKEDVNIVLEVCDNFMCPTDRGNNPTVGNDETERVDRERGRGRDGNGQLHDGNRQLSVSIPTVTTTTKDHHSRHLRIRVRYIQSDERELSLYIRL
jgi:hypothetical protein